MIIYNLLKIQDEYPNVELFYLKCRSYLRFYYKLNQYLLITSAQTQDNSPLIQIIKLILNLRKCYYSSCVVHYNRDLRFDFSNAMTSNLTYNESSVVFLNLCGTFNKQCKSITTTPESPNNTNENNTQNATRRILEGESDQIQNDTIQNLTDVTTTDDINTTTDGEEEENATIAGIDNLFEISSDNAYSFLIASYNQTNQQCQNLSKQDDTERDDLSFINEDKPFRGIIIRRRDLNEKAIKIYLKCNGGVDFKSVNNIKTDELYQFESKYACPQLLSNPLFSFYQDWYFIFAIVLIPTGVYLISYGFQIMRFSSPIICFLNAFIFTSIVLGEGTLDYDSYTGSEFIVFVFSLIIGFLSAHHGFSALLYSCFNIGFGLGTVFSLIINTTFYIDTSPIYLILILSIVLLGQLFGLLACCFLTAFGIISTAVIGSFCIVRPIAWFIGGYPTELVYTKQTYYGYQVDPVGGYIAYIIVMILISLASIYYQYKMYRQRQSMDELFSYQDMRYYEMGKVTLDEQPKQEQRVQGIQGLDFLKPVDESPVQERHSKITYTSKNSN
ncbi:hypothetical protein pb186bvf_015782 [Paramecium bursaria]